MKQIKELDLTECMKANIDDTNVVSSFVFDDVFDNALYVSGLNESLGYIDSAPSIANYIYNRMEFRLVKPAKSAYELYDWGRTIIHRLTDMSVTISDYEKQQTFFFVDAFTHDEVRLYISMTFIPSEGKIIIRFYYPNAINQTK